MPRAPLPPLTLGDRVIPLAWPPLALRTALTQTWVEHTGAGAEAPLVVQHALAFAAVGLAWETAHATGAPGAVPAAPARLEAFAYDLLRYGTAIGEAFDADDGIDGRFLIEQADAIAGRLIATVTVAPRVVKAAEALAVFSEARPGPDSAPGSVPPTDGSATPSAGTL